MQQVISGKYRPPEKKCISSINYTINCTFFANLKQLENAKYITKYWHGVVEFDGPGNEIFVTYACRIYNAAIPDPAAAKRFLYWSRTTRLHNKLPAIGKWHNGNRPGKMGGTKNKSCFYGMVFHA